MNTRLALGSLIQLTGTQLSIDDVYNKNRTKKANNKSTTRPQEYMESGCGAIIILKNMSSSMVGGLSHL